MSEKSYSIYWAGGLFSFKELLGNWVLARRVETVSRGMYRVQMPQDGELEVTGGAVDIRNADLKQLAQCDIIVANFDGTELDSGTVVEFCFAKALDIPALLLRTDFRDCGDRKGGDPWNLMCSGWSRTAVLWLNAMAEYQQMTRGGQLNEDAMMTAMAQKVVSALDRLVVQPSWLGKEEAECQYRRMMKSAGNGMEKLLDEEKCHELVQSKIARGVYD